MYTFGAINLNQYIYPSRTQGGSIALSGQWDMPARIGDTYQEWPDEHGIEPFLRADEIFFGGRKISFSGFVAAGSREEARENVQTVFSQIDGFSSLQPLVTPWGTYQVYMKDEARVTYLRDGVATVEFVFDQPIVPIPGSPGAGSSTAPGIDGWAWADLGLIPIDTGTGFNRAGTKTLPVTAYGKEGYRVGFRGVKEYAFEFAVYEGSYEAFAGRLAVLFGLMAAPGARTLRLSDGSVREVFCKDGFTVREVVKNGNEFVARLTLPLVEIRQLEDWNILTGGGLMLVDADGKPLTEIIKQL